MPLALVALAVGVVLASLLVTLAAAYLRLSGSQTGALLDYYAADAGVERAIAPLLNDPAVYAGATTLGVNVNGRPVSVAVAPLSSQTIVEPAAGGAITTTLSTYLATSTANNLVIRARLEARQIQGQVTSTVRITAWNLGPGD